ncbi:hypothetical protein BKH43_07820 [Helicobacter sp. 13S00401-1]|uniref:hypothetical protein n=1 Tax=Helicobacter sp. 13S00401-1 TaxID=1905758 RepID=UPI000BA568D4|nr:hypothetical protein [Helicobacter sp. 13S00401-1]PAF48615.1 hypothetical protein BKH43_07820 [Helicobacter sp. 13S00401-1]
MSTKPTLDLPIEEKLLQVEKLTKRSLKITIIASFLAIFLLLLILISLLVEVSATAGIVRDLKKVQSNVATMGTEIDKIKSSPSIKLYEDAKGIVKRIVQ